MSEQCFTSPPTQYRLYGRQFLQVKRPNQQYQSTEGRRFSPATFCNLRLTLGTATYQAYALHVENVYLFLQYYFSKFIVDRSLINFYEPNRLYAPVQLEYQHCVPASLALCANPRPVLCTSLMLRAGLVQH